MDVFFFVFCAPLYPNKTPPSYNLTGVHHASVRGEKPLVLTPYDTWLSDYVWD